MLTSRTSLFANQATRNFAHTVLLLGGMSALFAALGWTVFGSLRSVVFLAVVGLVSAGLGGGVSARLVLRMYRARPFQRSQAPMLFTILGELAENAGLARVPQPYYVPSRMINAFAVGADPRAAIGITDGLLRALSTRELRGVLAHEVTHIANKDAWVMGLADVVSRLVGMASWIGQLLLIFSIPAVLVGRAAPWPMSLVLLLILAPTLSALMQLALSRTREFDADLGAARISGDPRGLASALAKMERLQGGMMERVLFPGRRVPDPSLLRTHPPTEERVARLLAMESEFGSGGAGAPSAYNPVDLPGQPAAPRWHVTGSWY